MKGLESYRRRLDMLSVGHREALSPEQKAWLDSLTDMEVIELAEMIMGIKLEGKWPGDLNGPVNEISEAV
jgi:hypothetical protein